jgi:BirA family biotin operon repressor/biotin-[acetyl-CoA-carboxylase] ligase
MTTKEKIIQLLSENKDEFVSGEDLALKLSLSRAAVWKAIKALESDGYKIEAVTNRGYRICALPDKLDLRTLAEVSGLEPGQVIIFDSIDSTNKEAKRRIVEGEGAKLHKTLFAAEEQTAGRGRLERKFLSPAKKGVYFTLVYCPQTQVIPAVMTSAAAVSVCQAVEELYKTGCSVKWVNDIFSGGKKIAGILTEGITNFETGRIESAVIGIGVNIKPSNKIKKSAAKNIAGFLTQAPRIADAPETKGLPTRARFISEIAGQVFKILDEPVKKVMAEYKSLMFLIGKKLTVHPLIGDNKTAYNATAVDLDKNAGLIVKLPNGTKKTLSSGEVTLHNS